MYISWIIVRVNEVERTQRVTHTESFEDIRKKVRKSASYKVSWNVTA
jgi:hypothetical protein